jgi:mannitol repressor
MWPALVERRIDRLFEIALRPDKVIHNELFQPSGALGNYAVKVRLTYVLGSFEKDFYDDLLTLAKIRNRFAHRIEANDFSDQRINAWLRNLQGTKSLPGLIDQLRARAKEEELNPTAALHRKARPSTAGTLFIVQNILDDPQSCFRFSIDVILRQLDKCAENMKRNLSNLPGGWMTADVPAKEQS